MPSSRLLFEYSPWFILLCLLAGAGYAYLLYKKDGPWGQRLNYVLAGLRFLLVSLLSFLLIGPFMKQIRNNIEKPVYVVAIDNSASLAEVLDSANINQIKEEINKLYTRLKESDFQVVLRDFTEASPLESANELKFNHNSTNLNGLLSGIQTDFSGGNLAGVILVSDGIYNRGISPLNVPYTFDIFSVGVGDTVPKQDINLRTLYYNKIAYQGNKFPFVAEIMNAGYAGSEVTISVLQNHRVLAQKMHVLKGNSQLDQVELILEATSQGMQHYVVQVEGKEGEFTLTNNKKDAYIDIIEGKQKILLVASAPHPDIKAIHKALENNDNYELNIYIPEIFEYKEDKYDLVIFHQVPSRIQFSHPSIEKMLQAGIPTWYIIGSSTDINRFNVQNKVLQIASVRGEKDKVTPVYNQTFTKFNFLSESQSNLKSYPPVSVPFGKYQLKGDAEVILSQRIGNVETDRPLLIVGYEENVKSAVLLGEGIWQWRMLEYTKKNTQEAFDELITKLVQYLSSKEDRRKFKVYPVKNEFLTTESVVFETEVYNDIFEKIFNQSIDLQITGEDNKKYQYNYVTSESNTQYSISGLPQGIYKYTASTSLNEKRLFSSGEFTIQELQIETLNLTADHELLRNVSDRTGGKFFKISQLDQLADLLSTKEAKAVIYTDEVYQPIINFRWMFFILLLLISIEWFIRKYSGSY